MCSAANDPSAPEEFSEDYLVFTGQKEADEGFDFLGWDYDHDALEKRVNEGTATEEDHELFDIRLMQHFCLSVGTGKQPKPWVMMRLANVFAKLLAGGAWNQEMRIPWDLPEDHFSGRERRDFAIYCAVRNGLATGRKVTDLLAEQAAKHNGSYELARGAYYSWKRKLSKKDDQKIE